MHEMKLQPLSIFLVKASVGNPADEQCARVDEKPTVVKRDEKAWAIGGAI